MADKFYITTPIYYSNAVPHLGHAYATTLADILARFHRLQNEEVFFLTGTADHGQKIEKKAKEEGITPQELTDKNVASFKDLYEKLEISNDFFIRNSDKKHHWPGAQALWKKLVDTGDIYKGPYEGLYCVGCEKFLTEKELEDGKCPDHNQEPEKVVEENYFFRLSNYTDQLRDIIQNDVIRIYPEHRKNELISFISNDLEDVSFSRPKEKVGWAIPVPNDEAQNMYVWCEELSNYITAIGYGRDEEKFNSLWPADVHIVGKDILRFHAIIWPAMLISAGLLLPKSILATGLIISDGRKMSKTLGNVIDPQELISRYGAEAVRYYFARHVSPFSDSNLTMEGFEEAYTGNLVNGLGNLVARVLKMAETHLDAPTEGPSQEEFPAEYTEALNTFRFNEAYDFVWRKISELDERIARDEPFRVVKENKEKGKEIIAECTKELYLIARLLNPLLPEASKTIKEAILANKKPENLFPRLAEASREGGPRLES
ncbi:MAG: methionine--tRNA ligase [Candidatus Paceibacterota bacterium]